MEKIRSSCQFEAARQVCQSILINSILVLTVYTRKMTASGPKYNTFHIHVERTTSLHSLTTSNTTFPLQDSNVPQLMALLSWLILHAQTLCRHLGSLINYTTIHCTSHCASMYKFCAGYYLSHSLCRQINYYLATA